MFLCALGYSYGRRLKNITWKFANFMRYFMNKVNKAINLQLTLWMFTTVPSHAREHMYRLCYCSRRFLSCMWNPRKVLNYVIHELCELLCQGHKPRVIFCKYCMQLPYIMLLSWALTSIPSSAPRSGLSWKHHIDVGGTCIHVHVYTCVLLLWIHMYL